MNAASSQDLYYNAKNQAAGVYDNFYGNNRVSPLFIPETQKLLHLCAPELSLSPPELFEFVALRTSLIQEEACQWDHTLASLV